MNREYRVTFVPRNGAGLQGMSREELCCRQGHYVDAADAETAAVAVVQRAGFGRMVVDVQPWAGGLDDHVRRYHILPNGQVHTLNGD